MKCIHRRNNFSGREDQVTVMGEIFYESNWNWNYGVKNCGSRNDENDEKDEMRELRVCFVIGSRRKCFWDRWCFWDCFRCCFLRR